MPGSIAIKLALAGILAATSFGLGWEWRDRAADAELLEEQAKHSAAVIESQQRLVQMQEQARAIERLQSDRLAAVAEATALRNQERDVIETVIEKEVIRYVDRPNRVDVLLPIDWVRIHDTAALGRSAGLSDAPRTPSGPDARPASVSDAIALAVVTTNYNTCHAVRDQLTALRDWVVATREPRESL